MPSPERLRELAAAPDPRAGITRLFFPSPGDEGITDLLLIRHAQIEATTLSDDVHLTELGREQSEVLARYLSHERLDALYASPTSRARETAEAISRLSGLPIQPVPGLRDIEQLKPIDRPLFEVLAEEHGADEVPKVLERMQDERTFDAMGPFLEPGASFSARVTATLDGIIERHPGGRVAVVTHAPVIAAYVARILKSGQDFPFNPRLTSITRILVRDGRHTVDCVNTRPHFEPGPGA